MSTRPRWSRSSTIIPAQVPKIGPLEAAQRLVEPVEAHQPRDRGRLAARDDEPVEPVELLGLAHLDHAPRRAARSTPRARGSCPARRGRRSEAASPRLDCRGGYSDAARRAAAEPERDEEEADDGEHERGHPVARRHLGPELHTAVRPGRREVLRGREEPERAEHGPARAPRARADADVEEADERDQRPVRVAAVPPVEQRAADQDARRKVEPEAVRPLLAGVDPRADREVEEPDEERHDRRPVAAARDQVDDEEPRSQRRSARSAGSGRSAATITAATKTSSIEPSRPRWKPWNGEVPIRGRQPAEPLPERADERGERDHRREPEDAAGEPEAPPPEPPARSPSSTTRTSSAQPT